MIQEIPDSLGSAVAKEMVWLAWKACGEPIGMGWLQNRPNASKEEVWTAVVDQSDYPVRRPLADNEVYADYVFGRMMKLRFKYSADAIEFDEEKCDLDYHSWALMYPDVKSLVEAAFASVIEGS